MKKMIFMYCVAFMNPLTLLAADSPYDSDSSLSYSSEGSDNEEVTPIPRKVSKEKILQVRDEIAHKVLAALPPAHREAGLRQEEQKKRLSLTPEQQRKIKQTQILEPMGVKSKDCQGLQKSKSPSWVGRHLPRLEQSDEERKKRGRGASTPTPSSPIEISPKSDTSSEGYSPRRSLSSSPHSVHRSSPLRRSESPLSFAHEEPVEDCDDLRLTISEQ